MEEWSWPYKKIQEVVLVSVAKNWGRVLVKKKAKIVFEVRYIGES